MTTENMEDDPMEDFDPDALWDDYKDEYCDRNGSYEEPHPCDVEP